MVIGSKGMKRGLEKTKGSPDMLGCVSLWVDLQVVGIVWNARNLVGMANDILLVYILTL